MSHVGPGWSPTWRTHSCVPCRDSSRHLLCSLTRCASHARGPGVEKSLDAARRSARYVGDHVPHSGSFSFLDIRRSETEGDAPLAGGQVISQNEPPLQVVVRDDLSHLSYRVRMAQPNAPRTSTPNRHTGFFLRSLRRVAAWERTATVYARFLRWAQSSTRSLQNFNRNAN